MELVVKSNSFGVMEFTVKKPRYVPTPPAMTQGNVYGVTMGVPPPPVIQYPTTTAPAAETPPNDSPSSTE